MPESLTAANVRAARTLITDPSRWCRGAYGRRADGSAILDDASLTDAVAFCAAGAVAKAAAIDPEMAEIAIDDLLGAIDSQNRIMTDINDELGHTAVLATLDRIAACLALTEADDA